MDTFTAFGFDCGFDWWPTIFVNGIPPNLVCCICGLVPPSIAMVPCRHVICRTCYDSCVTNNQSRCCLDGQPFLPNDAVWSTISADSILERQIRCWNSPSGCDVTGAASEVLEHFKVCQHNVITCRRCREVVAHTDIVSHIASGQCVPAIENPALGVLRVTNALSSLDRRVSSFQADLKRIADSVEMSLEKMSEHSLVLESIHCLGKTLEKGMQLNGQAAAGDTEAQAALQNNLSAVMGSLEEARGLITELKASQNRVFEVRLTDASAIRENIKSDIDALSMVSEAERKEVGEKLKRIERMMEEMSIHFSSKGS